MEAPWLWGCVFTFTASISLVPIEKFTNISWMNERISSSLWYHPILSECAFPVPNRFPLPEDPLPGSSCRPSLVLQSLPTQPQSHSFPFCWKCLIIHHLPSFQTQQKYTSSVIYNTTLLIWFLLFSITLQPAWQECSGNPYLSWSCFLPRQPECQQMTKESLCHLFQCLPWKCMWLYIWRVFNQWCSVGRLHL